MPTNSELRSTIQASLDTSFALDFLVHENTHDVLHASPRHHCFVPTFEMWIFGIVPTIFCVFENKPDLHIPHHKREICIGALVAHKPSAASEVTVQNTNNAFDLVVIALAGGGKGLGMKEVEPVG